MKDWTDDYDHGLGIDGFWQLYYNGEKVFDLHDDKVPSDMDDDERLIFLVQSWDAVDDD